MPTILDYLQTNAERPFDQLPFGEIDALIIARIAYLPFDHDIVSTDAHTSAVKDASAALTADPELKRRVFWRYDVDLAHLLQANARFGNLTLSHYVNEIDETTEMQFSAVTFHLSEKCCYVAYRGTDATLVGWKEDFNMTFTCPIPAQTRAVEYLNRVAADCPKDTIFILGGHSKGGNLAIYAGAFCKRAIQDRIRAVYSFDAPGFPDDILRKEAYRRIRKRISAFIPQSSIVGLMLEHEEPYAIVKSTELIPLLQHDVYSWQLEGDHFCYLAQTTGSSRFLDRTLKGWIADMDPDKRESFVNALYDIVTETDAKTLRELNDSWFASARSIFETLSSLDSDTKSLLTDGIGLFVKNLRKSFSADEPEDPA